MKIVLFNRATKDAEDYTLYKTSLQKQYNPAVSNTPRYLDKTITAPTGRAVQIQTSLTLTQAAQAHIRDIVLYEMLSGIY